MHIIIRKAFIYVVLQNIGEKLLGKFIFKELEILGTIYMVI